MSKIFAPRLAKKSRKTVDFNELLGRELFNQTDKKLLQGARLDEVKLKSLKVKEQVRTKFNDSSINDLAENIRINGLIQPLVVHRDHAGELTLICGERRFRAMSSIDMESCPCFILEDKTEEELMAIQFSENSSREALHYIDKADGILNYQRATKASERKIVQALGISKSEVHRSLLIAKLPKKIKEAAKMYDIEKYVLIEYDAIEDVTFKKNVEKRILEGAIVKRVELKKVVHSGVLNAGRIKIDSSKKEALSTGISANAFVKAMQQKQKGMKMDAKTKKLLKELIAETKEIVDL